jgi:heme/copper-type cytochrome/quinol oxidase subunit 2
MKPSGWSVTTKLRLSQVMTVASVFGLTYCLGHMDPWAPPRDNIRWFIAMSIAFVVGLASVICLYYYRAKSTNDKNPDEIAVRTLAELARQNRRR